MVEETLSKLLGENVDPVSAGWQLRKLAEEAADQGPQLMEQIARQAELLPRSDPAVLGGLLRAVHTIVLHAGRDTIDRLNPSSIRRIESSLPAPAPNRTLLLQLLAMIRTDVSLSVLVEAIRESPPDSWIDAAQIVSPLMQHDDWPVDSFFPGALDCLQHPTLAAPILDLANYLVRTGRVARHPAANRLDRLNFLLGEVTSRLGKFEEDPRAFGVDVDQAHAMLAEAVALAVSLCDSVGLIGDPSSIGKLNQAVELRHRRVQCEAAGALARLGDDLGRKRLLELTADPAARLRAIQYADELDMGDAVEEEYRTESSTAEAEMALWLSQPAQMGVPPTGLDVLENRRLLWPGYHDPIDVNLVRFEYNFGERTYSNVGITGPITFAMSTDVANLPTDDIFAIYAGWQAEHPDIFAVSSDQFNESQSRVMGTLQKYLARLEYSSLKPELLGFFLDEQSGVFSAVRDDKQCVVVTDGLETIEQITAGRLRPFTPGDLFNLYKGRKILRTFNSGS